MANEPPSGVTTSPETFNTASKFFTIGAELIKEVQTQVGHSKVRSLRLTLGGRPIKDFPVSPATAIASIFLVVAAVVISNLRLEVIKDTDVAGSAASSKAVAAPGGAK